MLKASDLKVKIFADGADKTGMLELYKNPIVRGFTTNPTLMRKAGISDYRAFAKDILQTIKDRPISFEVFSDEFDEMERQAAEIAAWGKNVYVKIPITNTKRESTIPLITRLAKKGVKVNVTAILTMDQTKESTKALAGGPSCNISIFAGRIADAGVDPVPMMAEAVQLVKPHPQIEIIWASPREVLNVVQAHEVGCHIITATSDIIKKLPTLGKDLGQFSLETVQMFRQDAVQAGFKL